MSLQQADGGPPHFLNRHWPVLKCTFRDEQVCVRVTEVAVVLDSVEGRHEVERSCIMIHFTHVIVAVNGTQHMLWDVANGVLVLLERLTRVAILVNVDLQVLALGDVQHQQQVFQVTRVLNRVLEVDRVDHSDSHWFHLLRELGDRLGLFDGQFDAKFLYLAI